MSWDAMTEYARQGKEAFETGKTLKHCPYEKGSDEWMAWTSGFDLAGFDAQRKLTVEDNAI